MLKKKINRETFIKNIINILICQIFVKLISLIYRIYLSNKQGFGDTGNAIYGAGYQVYALLLTLSTLSIPSVISKVISEKQAKQDFKGAHRFFKTTFLLVTTMGLIGSIILIVSSEFIANNILLIPESALAIRCFAPSIFLIAMIESINGYFLGMQSTEQTAKVQAIEQITKLIAIIGLVELVLHFFGVNTKLMVAAASTATAVSSFVSLVYIYKFYLSRKDEVLEKVKNQTEYIEEKTSNIIKMVFKIAIPLAITSTTIYIYKTIDGLTIMRGLTTFLTEEVAKAQYGILSGKVDTLISMPLAFNSVLAVILIPTLSSDNAQNNKGKIYKQIKTSLLISGLFSLAVAFGLCIFAQLILNILFPNASQEASILQSASFIVFFIAMVQTMNGIFQGLGKYKIPVIALAIGIIVKIILNIVLIPIENIGIYGATISTTICYFLIFLIEFIILMKNHQSHIKN